MRHTRRAIVYLLVVAILLWLGVLLHDRGGIQSYVVQLPAITPAPTPARGSSLLHDIDAPFDWYVWEGYQYNGSLEPAAATNCGPAVVAMALQYATNNHLQFRPEATRTWMPGKQGTTHGTVDRDLTAVLDYWEIPWRFVDTMEEITAAVNNDHIVLLPIAMAAVTPEAEQAQPVRTVDGVPIQGRFYAYTGGHWIVVKGLVQASTTGHTYVVVYDPDVWEGNGAYYYEGLARYPKGLNRLYDYTEVERGYRAMAPNRAIEIRASPWKPAAVPGSHNIDPASLQAGKEDSAAFWCYERHTDVVGITRCESRSDL